MTLNATPTTGPVPEPPGPAHTRLEDYAYDLPEDRIAQHPAVDRSSARLLVLGRADGSIRHARVGDLPDLLRAHDLLVVNDTRVLPARVFGRKVDSGGRVEVLFLEPAGEGEWHVLLRASRRTPVGARLELADGAIRVVVTARGARGETRVRVEEAGQLVERLEAFGRMPLPPYIRRGERHAADDEDRARYQTVYAREPGAVAAPTAGLHLTVPLLEALRARGVAQAAVTLHVGLGTFQPVQAADVRGHVMHAERYNLPAATAQALQTARDGGGRIVAVGTTTVRTLETVAARHGWPLPAAEGRSDLFILPPYAFRAVDVLLTNFHLPRSTLLMLVCAFGGRDPVLEAYRVAVAEGYRFYSYGDAMLIL